MAGATDNMSLARKVMRQNAVYWSRSGTGDDGQPTYAAPVELFVRWDYKIREVLTPQGERVLSSSKVIVDRDMQYGDVLMLGLLESGTDESHPLENEGAWEVKSIAKTPDFKGKKFLREVYV